MTIKELRELTGQTQKAFSDNLGIPVGTLRRWEYGESTPPSYVIKMISEKLPFNNKSLKIIESQYGRYYYDKAGKAIIDKKGTRISINADLDDVNSSNLVLYANDLFEAYYKAVDKFNCDCSMDKQEGIIWG